MAAQLLADLGQPVLLSQVLAPATGIHNPDVQEVLIDFSPLAENSAHGRPSLSARSEKEALGDE